MIDILAHFYSEVSASMYFVADGFSISIVTLSSFSELLRTNHMVREAQEHREESKLVE